METQKFRLIGTIYVVFGWVFSTLGVIYSFFHLLIGNPFCSNILCHEDDVNTVIVAACLVLLILSTIFIAFVKGGIEDGNALHIRIFRVLMILRNIALAALWCYQYVILETARIHGDGSWSVRYRQYIIIVLLVGTTVITCIELWILNGILRLVQMKLIEEEDGAEAA